MLSCFLSSVNVSLDNNLLGQNEAEITKKQMKRSPKNLEDDSQDHQTYNRGLEKTFLLGKQQHKIFGTWVMNEDIFKHKCKSSILYL